MRHSATSPSISATTSSSYPPPPAPAPHFAFGAAPMTQVHVGLANSYAQPPSQPFAYPLPSGPDQYSSQYGQHPHAHYPQPGQSGDSTRSYYTNANGTPITPTYAAPGQGPLLSPNAMITQDPRSAPAGMFTRNLIGSLCVSAFKLTNPQGELGVWFILQDLSVRTEGSFRCVKPCPYTIANTDRSHIDSN